MPSLVQDLGRITGIRQQPTGASLALAIALMTFVVATQSVHAQTLRRC